MTVTKINHRRLKKYFAEKREEWVDGDWTDCFDSYRELLSGEMPGQHLLISDEWLAAKATKSATYEEIYSMLRMAASTMQDYGASDAQCKAIAVRWSKEGVSMDQCRIDRLPAHEARAILG